MRACPGSGVFGRVHGDVTAEAQLDGRIRKPTRAGAALLAPRRRDLLLFGLDRPDCLGLAHLVRLLGACGAVRGPRGGFLAKLASLLVGPEVPLGRALVLLRP